MNFFLFLLLIPNIFMVAQNMIPPSDKELEKRNLMPLRKKYSDIEIFFSGISRVTLIDSNLQIRRFGLIDTFGNELFKPEYDYLYFNSVDNIVYFQIDSIAGIASPSGKVYCSIKNSHFSDFNYRSGRFTIQEEIGVAYYNMQGEKITNNLFKTMIDTNYNIVFKKDTYKTLEIINKDLNFVNNYLYKGVKKIKNLNFDKIENLFNGMYKVKKDNKYGYLNSRGEIIVPINFTVLSSFYEKYLVVENKKNLEFFDKKGKKVDIISKYKNVNFNNLPIIETKENDTCYMMIIQTYSGPYFVLKDNAPNAYYKVFSDDGQELLYEGLFIETLKHLTFKNYYRNKLNYEKEYYFGTEKIYKIN